MEDSVNYAEYTVAKKAEGTNLRKRILLIVVYRIDIAAAEEDGEDDSSEEGGLLSRLIRPRADAEAKADAKEEKGGGEE